MGQTSTTETSLPKFQEDFLTETIFPRAQEIADQPFEAYTGQRAAAVAPQFQQAQDLYGQIGALGNMTPAQYQDRIAQNLAGMDTSHSGQRAALDQQIAQQRVGDRAALTKAGGAGAWGGDRAAITMGAREGEFDIQRAAQMEQLARQDYGVASQQALSQIGMGQTALGQQAAGLMGLGQQQQVSDQLGLDAAYAEFMREQGYPMQQLSALGMAAGTVPAGLGTSSTYQPASFGSILGALGSAGQGLAALGSMSDARLKTDIVKIGHENGINIYRWNWNETARRIGADATPNVGVIAQELREIRPDLVHETQSGYLAVNYGGL